MLESSNLSILTNLKKELKNKNSLLKKEKEKLKQLNKKIKKENNSENKYNICECGNKKLNNSIFCKKCNTIKYRKVIRPSYDILINDICSYGYRQTGKKYGVSDNGIKKWVKFYENHK